jgi:outer membrane autotransporter protein
MVAKTSIAIAIGAQCDGLGLNPYPHGASTSPQYGSVTVNTVTGVVTYANNGSQPGQTTDSFVLEDSSGHAFTIAVLLAASTSPINVTPTSLTGLQVGTSFSQSLNASGGAAPYTYAVTTGSLPSGLSLNGGTISGTPNLAGSYSFTLTVTDNNGVSAPMTYTGTVPNPSSGISVATPQNAGINSPYNYQLQASGALAPFTFAYSSGTLPPGISLAADGTLSGTPTATGPYNFSVLVTDGSSAHYFKVVPVTLTVLNLPPTAGAVSVTVAYNSTNNPVTLNITGATATSVAVGMQAMHGTATASGTSITYTPTPGYAGTDSFTYTATNGAGTSSPAGTVTVTVSQPTIVYAPTAPPHPTAGASYNRSIASASGGTAPYTYTVTAGTLPAGLQLANNGLISGTPSAQGSFTVQVTAKDSSTGTGPFSSTPANVTLVVDKPVITITPTTLPNGAANSTYSQQFTASNGTAPYTFPSASGLPVGMVLSSSGLLSGTPTQAGTFNITINVSDSTTGPSTPYTTPVSLTLTIVAPTITVSPPSLTNATVGTGYSQSMSASGGTAPYSFSASAGLPTGLTLAPGGTLSGTPTTAGDFNFTVTATDAQSFTGTGSYTVHVAAIAPGAPTGVSATGGDTQASVSFTAPANTGGSPITGYTVTSSPGGLTGSGTSSPIAVSGLTNGTAYTFTVTATNVVGPGAPSAASNAVTPRGGQTITFSNPGTQNFGTTPTLTASSTSGLPVTFSSSSTGVCTITGGGVLTFVTAGSCSINADQAGNGTFSAATQVTQIFAVAAVAPGAPTIGTATAGNTQASVSFTAPANTGGAAISGYTVTSSPGGLTGTGASSPVTVTGLTNGTAYTFTVTATNSANTGSPSSASNSVTPQGTQTISFANPGTVNFGTPETLTATATSGLPVTFSSTTPSVCTVAPGGALSTVAPGTCTINANQAGNATFLAAPQVQQSFAIAVPGGAVSFGTASPLPPVTGGTPYTQTITAVGGAPSYTFSITSGSLPTGLTFSSAGVLSGTPTSAGTYNFTLHLVDAATQTADKTYQLVVNAPAIALTPTTVPQGKVGVAYTPTTLSASGGNAPYTYSVTSGAVPAGLTLNPAGVLSGTPTAAGPFNFTVTATDRFNFQGSQIYSGTTDQQVPIVVNGATNVAANGSATIAVTSSGGPITSVAVTQSPTHGTAVVNGLNVVYTPATNYFGADTLQYTASGPGGTSTPATESITVVPGPVPVVTPQVATVVAGQPVTVHVTNGATNGPFVSIAIVTAPTSGTATVQGTDIAYTSPNASGTFGFDYTVSNPFGASLPAHVTVTVGAPTIAITPATLPAGKAAVAYTSTTLTSAGGTAPYTYAVTAGTLPAGLTLSPAGVLSGTPTAAGSFNVTVTSTDHYNFQGSQAYTIAIAQPVPIAVNDTASTNANGSSTIPVTSNDTGPITSITVTQQPSHGTATVNGLNVVYTPATNYFGADTLSYTATGPGGTSSPATVAITVIPGAVPVAAPQSVTLLAGKTVTIHAVAGATNGPFVSAAVITAPASGTTAVQGTDILYTAAADASGALGFDYTVSNPFGASKPAHVTLNVNPIPVAPTLSSTVIAGRTVQVDLTATAHGGPFTGAKVVSISPSNAGSATIQANASGYALSFTAAATFSGSAQLSYTLSNAFAESAPGTINVAVTPRSDPSKNAEVIGVLDAQADAARRMATGQISNFQQRLESLHSGTSASGFNNGITMTSASSLRNPQSLSELGEQQGMNRYRVQPDAGDTPQAPPSTTLQGGSLPGGVAVWTGGAVNFGKMQAGTSDNGIDFTTSGLSMGIDKAFSRDFAAGFGVGYGHDVSDVGKNGSRSALDSYNVAFYASYHPTNSVYVDALAGYQWLQFDARRYVTDDGNTVHGNRDGTQVFGSVSVGYEHQTDDMMLTPYGRLDIARAHLDGYTENGDSVYSLAYQGQTVKTSTGTLGLLAQWTFKEDYGVWSPQARAEFGHDMQGSNQATMRYADVLSGPLYQATLTNQSRNHTMLGVGVALQSLSGWLLRMEYQNYLDNTSSGNQSILLGVEKKFDP